MSIAGRGGPGHLRNRKRRSNSSRRWLERQLNDPYVAEAKRRGYRSRAAFKLIELDDRFRLLAPGMRVVDLGAAPGGWTQAAVSRVQAGQPRGGTVLAVDLAVIAPIEHAEILIADVQNSGVGALIRERLSGEADVVLSDMAPPSSGHANADHLRIMALAEAAADLAMEVLAPGGAFVCKVWQGGTEAELLALLKRSFRTVRHAKPPASRRESAEMYVVAQGFRGLSPQAAAPSI
ncbi:MAG: RlmE family RNA methyltransferase [Rhodospirillales bacterium]|jgi:23S rRNA (uridine2552-2'-O)-methyltransferase|nr:RlmE family RNA methyltransferase [Rhodospirillales bacterium]